MLCYYSQSELYVNGSIKPSHSNTVRPFQYGDSYSNSKGQKSHCEDVISGSSASPKPISWQFSEILAALVLSKPHFPFCLRSTAVPIDFVLTTTNLILLTTVPQHSQNVEPSYCWHHWCRWRQQRQDLVSACCLQLTNPSRYRSVRKSLLQVQFCNLTSNSRTVHSGIAKNKRQPYAVSEKAGEQTSAESWGTGM